MRHFKYDKNYFILFCHKNLYIIPSKFRVKYCGGEGPTVLGIHKFIINVRKTGFIVDPPRYERAIQCVPEISNEYSKI